MRALVLVLLAATPIAAASFVALPAPLGSGIACGAEACFALGPDDAAIRVQGARAYAFLDTDGQPILSGSLCRESMLEVPPGAVVLRVDPAPCP